MKTILAEGDYVRMYRKGTKKLTRTIWVVEAVTKSPYSETGYVCDVYAKNDAQRRMWGYDCDMFVKIS